MRKIIVFIVVLLVLFAATSAVFAASEPLESRLARVEEKVDNINSKIDGYLLKSAKTDSDMVEIRLQMANHEANFRVIYWLGTALWAIVMIFISQVARTWWDNRNAKKVQQIVNC